MCSPSTTSHPRRRCTCWSCRAITAFWRAVGQVAKALGLEPDGYRVLMNMGMHSGQEVPHFHVHICGGRPLGRMIPQD